MGHDLPAKKRRGFSLWTPIAIALLLGVGFYLAIAGLAGLRVSHARQGWARLVGSRQEIRERWPARPPNASALRVETLSAALGIDVATRNRDDRVRPEESRARAFGAVKNDLTRFVASQLGRGDRDLVAPPERLVAYLDEHEDTLEALRRHLVDGDVPQWEMSLEMWWEAPIPNLTGLIALQELLIADALVRNGAGDRAGALDDLDASFRLTQSLRDSPFLIVQIVTIGGVRRQAGALRHIEHAPEVWRRRLREHDYRRSFEEALALEGWMWSQMGSAVAIQSAEHGWQRVTALLFRPLLEYRAAELSERLLLRTERLRDLDHLCKADLDAVYAEPEVVEPFGSYLRLVELPRLDLAISRLVELEVDIELTSRLLAAEAAWRGGAWPDLPEIEVSATCPTERYTYHVGPDGRATIALEPEPVRPHRPTGTRLATRFTLGAPSRDAS